MSKLFELLYSRWDFFAELLTEHIRISATAIVLAMTIGLVMGIFISEFQGSAKPIMAIVNFVYTIPSISLLGFLIPFSGIGNTTAVIALTVYALLPMVRNTHTGLTHVNPLLIEAATGMGDTRLQTLVKTRSCSPHRVCAGRAACGTAPASVAPPVSGQTAKGLAF